MKRNVLGRTGLEVSELSFGAMTIGKIQAGMTPEEGAPAIQKAFELGINFFDTAQAYGTQKHLGFALGRSVDDVVIATKSRHKSREQVALALEEALTELGRQYIDIFHMHLVDDAADLASRREVLDFLLEQKAKGIIRAVGASTHSVAGAGAVAGEPDIDVLFPLVNSRGLGIVDGSVEDVIEVCRQAKAGGKGLYVMKPLAGGHLRQEPGEAFEFIRKLGLFESVCTGMKSPAEVEMNAALFEGAGRTARTVGQGGNITPHPVDQRSLHRLRRMRGQLRPGRFVGG